MVNDRSCAERTSMPDTFVEQRRLALFEEQRPRLTGIAYRMLGAVSQADDVLQEAWLRWSEANAVEVDNVGALLTTVVTRLSLDRLRGERVRREAYAGSWLPEPVACDPVTEDPSATVELTGSLSLPALAVMETLSPLERAAFVLRVVFHSSYAEVATALGRREPAVRQLVHRAQRHLAAGHVRFGCDRKRHDEVLHRFLLACRPAQIAPLLSVLAPDIVLVSDGGGITKAPPRRISGPEHVARFLVSVLRRLPRGAAARVEDFNATSGVVVRALGQPITALAIRADEDRVGSLQLVANPRKLVPLRPHLSRVAIV
jgi:RNA polymerase sigma-70 factor (ECF subfamily)